MHCFQFFTHCSYKNIQVIYRKYIEDNFKKWAISEVNNKGLRRLPKTQKEYDEAMIMFF